MPEPSFQGPSRPTSLELARDILSRCVQVSCDNGVCKEGLSKLLLDNLEAISAQSDDGLGTFDPDSTQMSSSHGSVPEVLDHLIRVYGVDGIAHIDRLLNSQHLNNDTLTFYRAGAEAIALKLSGVDEVLFKLSLFHDTPGHPIVLIPLRTMYLPQKDLPHDQKVRFSIVPFIAGEYQSFDELGLNTEQIRQHRDRIHLASANFDLYQRREPNKITVWQIEELLRCQGITWSDKKPANIRFHPNYADLPFIIDRRSVERVPAPNHARPTREQKLLLESYLAAQDEISKAIFAKYGDDDGKVTFIQKITGAAFGATYEISLSSGKDEWGIPASFIPKFRRKPRSG